MLYCVHNLISWFLLLLLIIFISKWFVITTNIENYVSSCNKLFADTTALEYHAMKSGHSNFAESTEEKKPLTEDEKKEQMKKLEERLKEKRKEREAKEKEEELEREKIRIRSGKEMSAAKKK